MSHLVSPLVSRLLVPLMSLHLCRQLYRQLLPPTNQLVSPLENQVANLAVPLQVFPV